MNIFKSAVSKVGQQLRTKLVSDSQVLLGQIAARQTRQLATISSLQDVEFKVFSQWGEDGILDWIIERAQIPARMHTFVEFGVESYQEANTRFLLYNRNWRGLVLDGGTAADAYLKSSGLALHFDITAKSAWITRDNINDLIAGAGFTGDIGVLSVDIDGNDYWVWEAIDAVRPVICVCEYNAVFGDLWPVSIPYEERFTRTLPKYSHLFYGASIVALRSLAQKKGYVFLGTTLAGNDAFFIREDYASRFEGSITNLVAKPSKARDSRNPAGKLSYAGGLERLRLVQDLPLINTETGETQTLRNLDPVYSKDWLEAMTSKAH